MEKIVGTGAEWTEITSGSESGDTLVVVESGFGRFGYGDVSEVDFADGESVSAGYRVIVPAGVALSVVARSGPSVAIIKAPFGGA